uniref:Uncharacterized protein n=1 Tax=Arundo donax TaxID=35708 RepID=A0A0A9C9N9_ARUDO
MSYVQAIWRTATNYVQEGLPVDVSCKRAKQSGCKKVDIDWSLVATIPLNKRTTIRSLAKELHVKKSTLHKLFKEGMLRRHSNTLKPYLKD